MASNVDQLETEKFVAHSSGVNCLKFGTKSGRVFVSGGNDSLVKVWIVGKPESEMSLSGLKAPVKTVGLDSYELIAAGGTIDGEVKLWDLVRAKAIRTFNASKNAIHSLEFHPFGGFLASASRSTLKIWDIRERKCIQTYKDSTNTLKMSPDGRWIITGGIDSNIKIWDLTAGKVLKTLQGHVSPVTSIAIHPHECLLATSEQSGCVKLWDINSYEMVGSMHQPNPYRPASKAVHSIRFGPDGTSLIGVGQNTMKMYGWEPAQCYSQITPPWSNIADFGISKTNQFIGANFDNDTINTWALDMMDLMRYPKDQTDLEDDDMDSATDTFNKLELDSKQPRSVAEITKKIGESTLLPSSAPKLPAQSSVTSEQKKSQTPDLTPASSSAPSSISASRAKSVGPSIDTFSKQKVEPNCKVGASSWDNEEDFINHLSSGHITTVGHMTTRLDRIRTLRVAWDESGIIQALKMLPTIKDNAACVDILKILILNPRLLNIEASITVLPLVMELLFEPYENFIITASTIVKQIIKNHHIAIKNIVDNNRPPLTQHKKKVKECFQSLQEVKVLLMDLKSTPGQVGIVVREALSEFTTLPH